MLIEQFFNLRNGLHVVVRANPCPTAHPCTVFAIRLQLTCAVGALPWSSSAVAIASDVGARSYASRRGRARPGMRGCNKTAVSPELRVPAIMTNCHVKQWLAGLLEGSFSVGSFPLPRLSAAVAQLKRAPR